MTEQVWSLRNTGRGGGGVPPAPSEARASARADGRRGSCLTLWSRKDVRAAVWQARMDTCRENEERAKLVRYGVLSSPCGAVTRSYLSELEREELAERVDSARPVYPPRRPDPVLDAWVSFVTAHMTSGSAESCFFSGSYSDQYGYPHGLMLARNVQADFRRALDECGLADREWVNAVEPHPSGRPVLHCHALVSNMTAAERASFEEYWTRTRGWSKAVLLHDGGVAYCAKYALKYGSVDSFDWSWS